MVEYDGEVEVADDGTLMYVFEDGAAVGVGGGHALDLGLGPGRSGAAADGQHAGGERGRGRLRRVQPVRVDDDRAGVPAALPSADRAVDVLR